jgi:hypothetical protein
MKRKRLIAKLKQYLKLPKAQAQPRNRLHWKGP